MAGYGTADPSPACGEGQGLRSPRLGNDQSVTVPQVVQPGEHEQGGLEGALPRRRDLLVVAAVQIALHEALMDHTSGA